MTKQLDAIPLRFDSTDHFDFLCPDCGCKMEILKLDTYDVPMRKGVERCTRFVLRCSLCKGEGHRKIYWKE